MPLRPAISAPLLARTVRAPLARVEAPRQQVDVHLLEAGVAAAVAVEVVEEAEAEDVEEVVVDVVEAVDELIVK